MAILEGASMSFMDAMKSQPVVLALCVMNFALIGFVYYTSSQFNQQRQDNVKLFIDVQKEVQKLLSQCIIPPTPERDAPQRRGDFEVPLPYPRPSLTAEPQSPGQ